MKAYLVLLCALVLIVLIASVDCVPNKCQLEGEHVSIVYMINFCLKACNLLTVSTCINELCVIRNTHVKYCSKRFMHAISYIRNMYWAVRPWSRVYKQPKRFSSTTGCHLQWNSSLPEHGVSNVRSTVLWWRLFSLILVHLFSYISTCFLYLSLIHI